MLKLKTKLLFTDCLMYAKQAVSKGYIEPSHLSNAVGHVAVKVLISITHARYVGADHLFIKQFILLGTDPIYIT